MVVVYSQSLAYSVVWLAANVANFILIAIDKHPLLGRELEIIKQSLSPRPLF